MHIPVLLQEIIAGLNIQNGDTYLDCTLNGGGHALEVAKRFGQSVKIIGIDLDSGAIERAGKELKEANADFTLKESNFRNLDRVLIETGAEKVERILFDLGWSTNQFQGEDGSGRGFSFQKDEPLLMMFKKTPDEGDITATQIVNEWEEETIANILYGYGEERYARRIAKKIVESRMTKKIETTFELVELIRVAVPAGYRNGRINCATKTFQALRIAVNDELKALEEALPKAIEALSPKGRLAVISFHSLEDRIVKNIFREVSKEEKVILINKKPITATDEEIISNPRSRSAKLRIVEKV